MVSAAAKRTEVSVSAGRPFMVSRVACPPISLRIWQAFLRSLASGLESRGRTAGSASGPRRAKSRGGLKTVGPEPTGDRGRRRGLLEGRELLDGHTTDVEAVVAFDGVDECLDSLGCGPTGDGFHGRFRRPALIRNDQGNDRAGDLRLARLIRRHPGEGVEPPLHRGGPRRLQLEKGQCDRVGVGRRRLIIGAKSCGSESRVAAPVRHPRLEPGTVPQRRGWRNRDRGLAGPRPFGDRVRNGSGCVRRRSRVGHGRSRRVDRRIGLADLTGRIGRRVSLILHVPHRGHDNQHEEQNEQGSSAPQNHLGQRQIRKSSRRPGPTGLLLFLLLFGGLGRRPRPEGGGGVLLRFGSHQVVVFGERIFLIKVVEQIGGGRCLGGRRGGQRARNRNAELVAALLAPTHLARQLIPDLVLLLAAGAGKGDRHGDTHMVRR